MADSWNSVQIVTVAVNALTPVTVVVLGVLFARASRRIEQVQWGNQTVVTHRLAIFAQLAPGLNQLLCFGTFVGGWKEIDPRKAVEIKRKLDETMYANRVLFSDELFAAYQRFMATLFAMFAATDADALVRAPITIHLGDRRNLPWWNEAMTRLFSSDTAEVGEIQAAYEELSRRFRADLNVTGQARPLLATQP
jgi:hypothetical protein